MTSNRSFTMVVVVAFLWMVPSVCAEVTLPSIIGSNMVLQKSPDTPIWGWASPGEKIRLHFAGKEYSTTADSDGNWKIPIDLTAVDGEGPFSLTVSAGNTLELENILLGEVWLCSGQSNMQWTVKASGNPDAEIAAGDHPRIRMFVAEHTTASGPQKDVRGKWLVCTPQTVGGFSAVAYYFGRGLQSQIDKPVGLVHSSWGGTPSEAWTNAEKVAAVPAFKPIVERWRKAVSEFPNRIAQYQKQIDTWLEETEKLDEEGKPLTPFPKPPHDPRTSPHRVSVLYNAMIHPLIPYRIRGAIWYQGESNDNRAYQYRTIFPAMIEGWREKWGQGEFPFYWVQLANFKEVKEEPGESAWAELREAQTMALRLPNTGQAVIIDIGEAHNIHPKNKQDVGWRLALIALAKVYGMNIIYSGPMYRSMKVEGNKVRIHFDHVGGGLKTKNDEPLKGFAIAGKDKKFYWADAVINPDNTVTVSSSHVPEPVAVRYAWADNPVCNLYNNADLPACPFRTDDWPGITIHNE